MTHGQPDPAYWVPDDGPPTPKRAALMRLAEALRKNIELLMTSDAAEEELLAGAEDLEALAARLERSPKGRALYGYAETATAGAARSRFEHSPVVGVMNAIAPPLIFAIDGQRVVGTGRFGYAYEGPPGHVHGGFIAAALDDLLGMAQGLTELHGMTGTLTVKYRKPVPLETDVRFEAQIDRQEGRKLFVVGGLYIGETVHAEAEAVFIQVDFEVLRKLAAERMHQSEG